MAIPGHSPDDHASPPILTVNDYPAQDTSSGSLRTADVPTRDVRVTNTLFADVSEFQPV